MFWQLLGFFIELVFVPLLYLVWVLIEQGNLTSLKTLPIDSHTQGWLNLLAILSTAVALGIFYRKLEKSCREEIFGSHKSKRQNLLNVLIGVVTWLIAYPWILTLSQVTGMILQFSYHEPHVDQVAVRHIKEILSQPMLLSITIFTVILIIPVLEELLFRGFLQVWLKSLLGTTKAILLTSVVFAIFHFSASQGIENVEILLSLFILSCYLGFVRERQNSLLSSIALHTTFNTISIIFLLNQIDVVK